MKRDTVPSFFDEPKTTTYNAARIEISATATSIHAVIGDRDDRELDSLCFNLSSQENRMQASTPKAAIFDPECNESIYRTVSQT